MRQKKPLEIVVSKYMLFLTDIRDYGEDFPACYISQLIEDYKINKSVKMAMRELAIIDYEKDNLWHWLQGDVTKELVLTVLNYINDRAKKQKVVAIAGLEHTNAVLQKLSETVSNYIHRRETVLKVPQIASNGNLFSEVDTKNDLVNKAAFAIASSTYYDTTHIINIKEPFNFWNDQHIHYQNERIVFAAKDLVNQLLK